MDHKWDTLVNQYIPLRKLTKKEIKNRFKAWITSGIHWLINTFRLENLPRKKLKTDSNFRMGSQVGYTG